MKVEAGDVHTAFVIVVQPQRKSSMNQSGAVPQL
jgi:hypothetical protein